MHGQDDYPRVRALVGNPFAGFDAIHAGHGDISDHELRLVGNGKGNGFFCAGDVANDVEAPFDVRALEALAHHSVVVYEEE